MTYLKTMALAATLAWSAVACSAESAAKELVVRVTAQGTCESESASFDCTLAGEKLQPRCLDLKCSVRIETDPNAKSEHMTDAFASLLQRGFSRVHHEQHRSQVSVGLGGQ